MPQTPEQPPEAATEQGVAAPRPALRKTPRTGTELANEHPTGTSVAETFATHADRVWSN